MDNLNYRTAGDFDDAPTAWNPREQLLGLDSVSDSLPTSFSVSSSSDSDTARASDDAGSMVRDRHDPIVALPAAHFPNPVKFEILQEWEGVVTSIQDDDFTAEIVDITNERINREEATLPISDLSDDDKKLLDIDAIFRWMIGYQVRQSGSRVRVSKIIFRRLPVWTPDEIMMAKRNADEIVKNIQWD